MRLIDADELINGFIYPTEQFKATFTEMINDEPTIEAEPVRHGRWEPYEFATNKRWRKCSVCGTADEYINEVGLVAIRNYCPNCGAKMDEVKE